MFRSAPITPEFFWRLNKAEQADLIWKTLFVENSPVSEAARGVITVLEAFGLDPYAEDLSDARDFFRSQLPADHITRVLDMGRVSDVVMTNDPFDPQEADVWESGVGLDSRFHAALRMDRLLNDWEATVTKLAWQGYRVDPDVSGETVGEVRRFLDRWIA